jgi:hypothetical protein
VFSKVNDKSKTDFAVKQESTVEDEEETSIISNPKPEASLATSTVGQDNNTSNDCSEDQGTTSERDNNTRFVPREPRDDRQPGAFRQDGRNAREVLDDYDWEGTHSDSDTQLIEVPAEVPDPDEVSRMVEQGLAEWERNVVNANVIIYSEEAPDEGTNRNSFMKQMVQHLCDSRKKQMIIGITAIVALTCVGVLLGVFVSPPTQSPSSLCDESSSSLAKRIPCVSQDESKFYLDIVSSLLVCLHCMYSNVSCHFLFYSFLGSLQQQFDGHHSKSACLDVKFV